MGPTPMSSDGSIDKKKCDIQAMNNYSALEKKEILTQSTTWMNPEDILLGK